MGGTSKVFLRAEWRNLALLSFPIDAALLATRLPRGLELDLWQGMALMSLVGFQFLGTRGVISWRSAELTSLSG